MKNMITVQIWLDYQPFTCSISLNYHSFIGYKWNTSKIQLKYKGGADTLIIRIIRYCLLLAFESKKFLMFKVQFWLKTFHTLSRVANSWSMFDVFSLFCYFAWTAEKSIFKRFFILFIWIHFLKRTLETGWFL